MTEAQVMSIKNIIPNFRLISIILSRTKIYVCVEQECRVAFNFFFFLLANKGNEKRTIIVRRTRVYDDETKMDLFFNRRPANCLPETAVVSRTIDYDTMCVHRRRRFLMIGLGKVLTCSEGKKQTHK